MVQFLHGCATTTEAVRAIQNSQESLRSLTKRYGINQKMVAKWKQRDTVADLPTGPKEAKSTTFHRGRGDHCRFSAAYALSLEIAPMHCSRPSLI